MRNNKNTLTRFDASDGSNLPENTVATAPMQTINNSVENTSTAVSEDAGREHITSVGGVGSSTPTYEEFLKTEHDRTEDKINQGFATTEKRINDEYDEQVADINQAHHRTMTDIDTSYQKNLAGYGKNAELLASMGLTGSGYSDYLNSQAAAQRGASERSANAYKSSSLESALKSKNSALETATATKDKALFDADTSYNTALMQHRTENFNQLYDNALKGMYSELDEETLNKLINESGLTGDQVEKFKGAISFAKTQKAEILRTQVYSAFGEGCESVESAKFMLNGLGVSSESDLYNEIISEQQRLNADNISYYISQGQTITSGDLEKLVEQNEITAEQKMAIMKEHNIVPQASDLTGIEKSDVRVGSVSKEGGTLYGSVNGKNYNVSYLPSREELCVMIGNNTYRIPKNILHWSLSSANAYLRQVYGDSSSGQVAVKDGKCYINAFGRWYEIPDSISKEMIRDFERSDTSYAANVGSANSNNSNETVHNTPPRNTTSFTPQWK